jgi:hypothetical protein
MIDLHEEFVAIARAFEQQGIPYAVCGGMALAAHGFPRATVDIDLLIPDDHMDKVRSCLKQLGYDHESGWMTFAGGGVRLFRVVKLDPSAGDFLVVDLLAASGDLTSVWEQRQRQETPDGSIWIVSRPGLIAMKRGRGSKQDLADIENLEGIADED